MADQFHVDADELMKYVTKAREQGRSLPRISSALAHIQIPHGAFGKLPDSDELQSSFREHASAAEQNVKDLAEVLSTAADSLREVAAGYLRTDLAEEQGLKSLGGGL